jgi:hypothetical protein
LGSQLALGGYVVVENSESLFSPTASLGINSSVGDLQTNSLLSNENGHYQALTPFPAAAMPPSPLAQPVTASTTAVTVASGATLTLSPGNYGDLTIGSHAQVFLNPGTYSFSNIVTAEYGHLNAQAGGVDVRVSGTVNVARYSSVEPHCCTGLPASDLSIEVLGNDQPGMPAVSILPHSTIDAILLVPHGTLSLGNTVVAKGAFFGFDIVLGSNVDANFESGFPTSPPGQQGSQQLSGYFGNPSDGTFPLAGVVPGSTVVELDIGLPMQHAADFKTFVANVSDPANAQFRQFISDTDFNNTYGGAVGDYTNLRNWAAAAGFTEVGTSADRLLLSVTGTADQIRAALFTNLVYRGRADGSAFVTVDREPSLNLAVPLLWIAGFDDYMLPMRAAGPPPCGNPPNPAQPTATFSLNSTGGFNGYWAPDIRNAYLGGTACAGLTGANQVVGLFEEETFSANDLALYDNAPQNNPTPGRLSTANVGTGSGTITGGAGSGEAILDVDMVQAMAPAAKILVFEGATLLTNHADSIFNAMSSATLTSASSSWAFGASANVEQSMLKMAGKGVAFFTASGDYGNIGDPQDSRDLEAQVLVGGTFLSTNALGSTPYYANELTWNTGCLGKNVTSGGIMNGKSLNVNSPPQISFSINPGECVCFPSSNCCNGVGLPTYQQMLPVTNNGASNLYRNFPDVSWLAADILYDYQGVVKVTGGTSAAAPLWAGLMALTGQAANANGVGLRGYINPTLYQMGETKGRPGTQDLYATSFHDVQDGVTNLPPPFTTQGFASVPGYDLATGWGSPTCGLVQQLANFNPLAPATYDHMWVHLASGHDGVEDSSGVTLDVFSGPTTLLHTYQLKNQGVGGWHDFGQEHDIPLPLLDQNNNPISLAANGIDHFVLNLQNGGGDNWDVMGISVFLANLGTATNPGSSPYACELLMSGGQGCTFPQSTCNALCCPSATDCGDGHDEIVRLSDGPSCSGVGNSQSFTAGLQGDPAFGGCIAGGQPTGSAVPIKNILLQFDTGDGGTASNGTAGLRNDSELDVDILDSSGNKVIPTTQIKSGGSSDDLALNEDSEEGFLPTNLFTALVALPGGGLTLPQFSTIRVSLVSHDSTFETNDSWRVNAVYVWGIGNSATTNGAAPYTCLFAAAPGEPEFNIDDSNPVSLEKQSGCPF